MIGKSDFERVQQQLAQHIGERVKICVHKGRKRMIVRYGTIGAVYPYTFNVLLESVSEFAESTRAVSLNYGDILTKVMTVELTENGTEIV